MIVPYAVVRSNNIPLREVEGLTASRPFAEMIGSVLALEDELEAMREATCDTLFELAHDDPERFRELIALKRSIFKSAPARGVLDRFAVILAAEPELGSWRNKARELVRTLDALHAAFDKGLASARARARSLAAEPAFQEGMSFARGAVSRTAIAYARGGNPLDKKALNDEETVLRYLGRALLKVSPFSSFTSVGFAPIVDGATTRLRRERALVHRYSYDRATVLKLYEAFVLRHFRHFRFSLTANTSRTGRDYAFDLFIDAPGTYAYRSAYGRSRAGASRLLQALDGDWIDGGEIADLLPADVDVGALVGRLVRSDILSYRPALDCQGDDLIGDFLDCARLVAATRQDAVDVCEALERIHEADVALRRSNGEGLRALSERIDAAFRELALLLDKPLVKTTGLVYHDTAIGITGAVDRARATTLIKQAEEFLHHYLGCNFRDGFSDSALKELRDALPPDRAVGVFEFHAITRECKGFSHEDLYTRTAAMEKLLALHKLVWANRNTTELHLPQRALESGTPSLPFCIYGHLCGNSLVVNNFDSGYLRSFSRFFTYADDASGSMLAVCREAYGATLAEGYDVYDTFGYNTARRPRICGRRIWLDHRPPDHTGDPNDIHIGDLEVVWPSNLPGPVLRRRDTLERVRIHHTSLFVTSLYPKPIELLMRFESIGKPCYFAFRFGLYKLVAESDSREVVAFPRIHYGDLVLSRRQWWLRRNHLPDQSRNESGAQYLTRLARWRAELGIPDRVFLRRHQREKVLERDVSNYKKPLFIDFTSPIHCRMITRTFRSAFDWVSIEESLPDACGGALDDGSDAYACELILERSSQDEESFA